MPIKPEELIVPGAGLLGQGFSAINQGVQNRANRRWNEKMAQWARNAALTDWGLMNEYNSPKAQMQRYKDAGLNPNLIYGQSNEGATIRSQDTASGDGKAMPIDLQTPVMGFYDMRMKAAQVNNLEEQLNVLRQEQYLKAAQVLETTARTGKTAVDTELAKMDLKYAEELKKMSLEVAKVGMDKTKADTQFTLDENDRKAAMQGYNIQTAVEAILRSRQERAKSQQEIEHIKQQIENLKQDNRLKQFDEDLQKNGIPRNSPAWWKALSEAFDAVGGGFENPGGIVEEEIKRRGWHLRNGRVYKK